MKHFYDEYTELYENLKELYENPTQEDLEEFHKPKTKLEQKISDIVYNRYMISEEDIILIKDMGCMVTSYRKDDPNDKLGGSARTNVHTIKVIANLKAAQRKYVSDNPWVYDTHSHIRILVLDDNNGIGTSYIEQYRGMVSYLKSIESDDSTASNWATTIMAARFLNERLNTKNLSSMILYQLLREAFTKVEQEYRCEYNMDVFDGIMQLTKSDDSIYELLYLNKIDELSPAVKCKKIGDFVEDQKTKRTQEHSSTIFKVYKSFTTNRKLYKKPTKRNICFDLIMNTISNDLCLDDEISISLDMLFANKSSNKESILRPLKVYSDAVKVKAYVDDDYVVHAETEDGNIEFTESLLRFDIEDEVIFNNRLSYTLTNIFRDYMLPSVFENATKKCKKINFIDVCMTIAWKKRQDDEEE